MRKLSDKKKHLLSMATNIVEQYTSGATLRYLAEIYETSTGSIRTLLLEESVTMRKIGRRKKENV